MIRNIIFDFGGVIYDVCYEKVNDALVSLGAHHLSQFYSKGCQTQEMDLLEKGLISVPEFRDYMRSYSGLPLTDDEVDWAINAVLIDVPQPRVELLLALRGITMEQARKGGDSAPLPSHPHYRTFLFSNTNQINYDCFTAYLRGKYGFDIFRWCFERAYFSHFMHTRKPNVEGFRQILDDNGLLPDETLFIDDIAVNAEAARRAGLHAHHLTEGDISELFTDDLRLKVED